VVLVAVLAVAIAAIAVAIICLRWMCCNFWKCCSKDQEDASTADGGDETRRGCCNAWTCCTKVIKDACQGHEDASGSRDHEMVAWPVVDAEAVLSAEVILEEDHPHNNKPSERCGGVPCARSWYCERTFY
jgi:hypothetical protein